MIFDESNLPFLKKLKVDNEMRIEDDFDKVKSDDHSLTNSKEN